MRRSGRASRFLSVDLGRAGHELSLFSEHAERVELCLFDDEDREERLQVPQRTVHNWHCYLPGVGPASATAIACTGLGRPSGAIVNPSKLLIDPYGKSVEGPIRWEQGRPLP